MPPKCFGIICTNVNIIHIIYYNTDMCDIFHFNSEYCTICLILIIEVELFTEGTTNLNALNKNICTYSYKTVIGYTFASPKLYGKEPVL